MLHTTLSTTPEWLAYPSLNFVPKWLAYPSLKVLWQVDFYEKFEKSLFACSNWEDWDQYFAKRMGEKAFLLFKINKKKKVSISLTPYSMLTTLTLIHPQLAHVMQIAVWCFISARELFSIWLFRHNLAFVIVWFSLCQHENSYPFLSSKKNEEAKIWWNPQVHHRTRSLALSNRGSYWNQEEWLDKLDDSSPANEAEGQTTTSAHHMKLLENGHHSKT